MRSRYTAFARREVDYLLRTWHPETRPPEVVLEPGLKWVGLEVLEVAEDPPAGQGAVEFVARFKAGGRAGRLREVSRFRRLDGAWYYLDGAPPRSGAAGPAPPSGSRPSSTRSRPPRFAR